MNEQTPWVCPWAICNHYEAQACRAMNGTTKLTRGCGSRFPQGTTLEQAKAAIGIPAIRATPAKTDTEGKTE